MSHMCPKCGSRTWNYDTTHKICQNSHLIHESGVIDGLPKVTPDRVPSLRYWIYDWLFITSIVAFAELFHTVL